MRRSAIVALAVVLFLGFGLFQLAYEIRALEDRLESLDRQLLEEEEALHVLRAEWAYLNTPQRLAALSARHLALEPVKDSQIRNLAELPRSGANVAKHARGSLGPAGEPGPFARITVSARGASPTPSIKSR